MQRQKQKQKRPTRRSMTFSGCFTCRARGVKCDEQRPACQRCAKAKRTCAGYGVRLIWEDRQKNPKANLRSERRSLPWAYGEAGGPAETPALREEQLDAIIAALSDDQGQFALGPLSDPYGRVQAQFCSHPHARLFTVFVVTPPVPAVAPCFDDVLVIRSLDSTHSTHSHDHDLDRVNELDEPNELDDLNSLNGLNGLNDLNDLDLFDLALEQWRPATPAAHGGHNGHNGQHGHHADVLRLCPSPQPTEESRLLDYWVSHTSSIMIPIPRRDNPFRTIFVPMALVAQSQLAPSSEHRALLHGIYAMAAFNCAQQQTVSSRGHAYNSLGMNHHQLCLAHLQHSLSLSHASNPEAILATIILMITTNCITGNSTAWRTHIHLGRQWLLSSVKAPWRTQHAASTLYQIFLMLEAIGTSANMPGLLEAAEVASGTSGDCTTTSTTATTTTETTTSHGYDYTYNSIFGLSCTALYHDYQLDSLYGITQPMFEAIVHINRLGARPAPPSQQELENLRIKILLNDPRALRGSAIANAGDTERRFVHHHAYVFYFACRIHYERVLFRVAPHAIQNLVRCALDHLEAIASLETNMHVAGLTWPVFVIACEADDPGLQKRVSWYFEKGEKYGIWSISSAHHVLSEVWRRRRTEAGDDPASVRWQQVMADLGLDLLLT